MIKKKTKTTVIQKVIKSSELTIWKMSCDSKQKLPQVVIQDGDRKRWVGIGWVNEGKATKQDYTKYPTVTQE